MAKVTLCVTLYTTEGIHPHHTVDAFEITGNEQDIISKCSHVGEIVRNAFHAYDGPRIITGVARNHAVHARAGESVTTVNSPFTTFIRERLDGENESRTIFCRNGKYHPFVRGVLPDCILVVTSVKVWIVNSQHCISDRLQRGALYCDEPVTCTFE